MVKPSGRRSALRSPETLLWESDRRVFRGEPRCINGTSINSIWLSSARSPKERFLRGSIPAELWQVVWQVVKSGSDLGPITSE
jgi:hypothetical protein